MPRWSNSAVPTTNRTNLELKRIQIQITRFCQHYQSYQSGIETQIFWRGDGGWCDTTNRTNLELKLKYFEEGMVDDVTLPIVPIWNWNMRFLNLFKWLFATNRTNLELKLIHACLEGEKEACYQSYQSGIETCERVRPAVCMFLPIVPIWDWNQQLRLHRFRRWWSTNRTNLELKRQ